MASRLKTSILQGGLSTIFELFLLMFSERRPSKQGHAGLSKPTGVRDAGKYIHVSILSTVLHCFATCFKSALPGCKTVKSQQVPKILWSFSFRNLFAVCWIYQAGCATTNCGLKRPISLPDSERTARMPLSCTAWFSKRCRESLITSLVHSLMIVHPSHLILKHISI